MVFWIVTFILIILLIFITAICFYLIKHIGRLKRDLQKNNNYKRVSRQIIFRLIDDPHFLEKRLNEKNYNKIAIYGNNEYTHLIADLLKSTGIEIAYVIAPEWSVSAKGVKLVRKGEEEVDATIVVTENKKSSLDGCYQGEYLSFYELVYNKI